MRKVLVWIAAALILSGCGAEETFETISDVWDVPAIAEPREISVELPGEAAVSALQSDAGRLYIGEGYEICIETMASGDLNATIRQVSGYDKNEVTLISTESDGVKRHEFVWAAAGECGEKTGQCVILDDGNYHYTMSVLKDAEKSKNSQIIWSRVFHSFSLV